MKRLLMAIGLCGMMAAGCSPLELGGNEAWKQDWGNPDTAAALAAGNWKGSAFTKQLATEYQALSKFEKEQYDWRDHERWARKGLLAGQGTLVHPEIPERWNLTQPNYSARVESPSLDELYKQRERLMQMFYACNARDKMPKEAAIAQVAYDCWIEELEEGWEAPAIAACRDRFMANLKALEPTCVVKPTVTKFSILFDFSDDRLNAGARKTVAEAAAAAGKDGKVFLVGWADRVGNPRYNMALSKRRVMAVRTALVEAGVPDANISADAKGENDLPRSTADNVKEPMNRAVHISVNR